MLQKDLQKLVDSQTNIIINDLLQQLNDFFDKNDMDKAKFARMIGCTKGYMSQLFNGTSDHKLSKIVMLSLCIGKLPVISFKDIPSYSLHFSQTSFDIPSLPD